MVTYHTIIITYWLTKPEFDLADLAEIRQLAAKGIHDAGFLSGHKRMLTMRARFNANDPDARIAAASYAYKNASRLAIAEDPAADIVMHRIYLDGHEIEIQESAICKQHD